jgi:anti-repressor protein
MSLIPFAFEGAPVRVIAQDDTPWFVLADVCRILEISNPSDAAKRLDEDEKMSVGRGTLGLPEGAPMTIISEPGMYRLVMRSDKPAAKRFQKWVVSEVLPSIRKTGGYQLSAPTPQPLTQLAALKQALAGWEEAETLRQQAETKLIESKAQADELAGKVQEMEPTVEAFERIAASDGSLCITDAAKNLQIGPKKLFAYLRANGWTYNRGSHDVAYQARISQGVLEHKISTVLRPDGSEKTVTQVRVTPKGLARLAKEFPTADQQQKKSA